MDDESKNLNRPSIPYRSFAAKRGKAYSLHNPARIARFRAPRASLSAQRAFARAIMGSARRNL
jgi:hypothetical protein